MDRSFYNTQFEANNFLILIYLSFIKETNLVIVCLHKFIDDISHI